MYATYREAIQPRSSPHVGSGMLCKPRIDRRRAEAMLYPYERRRRVVEKPSYDPRHRQGAKSCQTERQQGRRIGSMIYQR